MISDGDSNISAGFENTQGYKDAIQDAWKEGATQYLQEGVKSDQVYEMLKDQIDLKKNDADLLLPVRDFCRWCIRRSAGTRII